MDTQVRSDAPSHCRLSLHMHTRKLLEHFLHNTPLSNTPTVRITMLLHVASRSDSSVEFICGREEYEVRIDAETHGPIISKPVVQETGSSRHSQPMMLGANSAWKLCQSIYTDDDPHWRLR